MLVYGQIRNRVLLNIYVNGRLYPDHSPFHITTPRLIVVATEIVRRQLSHAVRAILIAGSPLRASPRPSPGPGPHPARRAVHRGVQKPGEDARDHGAQRRQAGADDGEGELDAGPEAEGDAAAGRVGGHPQQLVDGDEAQDGGDADDGADREDDQEGDALPAGDLQAPDERDGHGEDEQVDGGVEGRGDEHEAREVDAMTAVARVRRRPGQLDWDAGEDAAEEEGESEDGDEEEEEAAEELEGLGGPDAQVRGYDGHLDEGRGEAPEGRGYPEGLGGSVG